MRVEVLVSVMNLKNTEVLLKQMQIASDVLIINQCNKNEDEFYKNNEYTVRVISTTTRGLSLSRNMALDNAIGDICLLCDDDEVLYSDYREKIVQEFIRNPEADIICFKRDNTKKRYLPIRYRINKMTALHVSSVEIAIKKNKIVEKKIRFNERFGAGTRLYMGEENIFLYDCLDMGLKIFYAPIPIVKELLNNRNSTWFKGYNLDYFYVKGVVNRQLMGNFFSIFYNIYLSLKLYNRYKRNIGWFAVIRTILANKREN